MMISPETYYDEHLSGKSAKQIMTAIRGLMNEIGRLKNKMENPDYGKKALVMPSESTRLWCTRLYLERAKEALLEVGGEFKPSKTEIDAEIFDDNISEISNFTLSIGGFFGGYELHTINLTDGKILHKIRNSRVFEMTDELPQEDELVSKDEFFEAIRNLHMGEWRRTYDTNRFGILVLDGTQWNVEIEYKNGIKSVSFSGSNAYPYNFQELKDLLGMKCEPFDDA